VRGWLVGLRGADWRSIDRTLVALTCLTAIGQAAYPVGWLIAGSFQDGYSAVDNYVSDLGALTATDPWIMNTGFLLFGASFVTLALALARSLPRSPARTVAAGWFAATGVAIGSAAFLQEDCWSATDLDCWAQQQAGQLSWHHYAHITTSGVFGLLFWLSPLILWFAIPPGVLRRACGWCAVIGALPLVLILLPHRAADGPRGGAGLIERIAAGVMNAWVLALLGAVLLANLIANRGGGRTTQDHRPPGSAVGALPAMPQPSYDAPSERRIPG
jgi:hypothetical protein